MKKSKTLFLFLALMFIFLLASVAEVSAGCCVKQNNLYVCQDCAEAADCAGGEFRPLSCNSYGECIQSCCIGEFFCTTKAYEICKQEKGTPQTGSCTNYPECSEGCCIIGINWYPFVSRLWCAKHSPPGQVQFFEGLSEQECRAQAEAQDLGCCRTGEGCKMMTRGECPEPEVNFHEGLCSEFALCACFTDINKGAYYKCKEDERGRLLDTNVWLYDSCGNPVKVHKQCNYPSTVCGLTAQGNYDCISVSCGTHAHGSKWCEYDNNQDHNLVGSRHWLYECWNGRTILKGCDDKRAEICKEGTKGDAGCVENKWEECLGLSPEDCQANEQCKLIGGGEYYCSGVYYVYYSERFVKKSCTEFTTQTNCSSNSNCTWRTLLDSFCMPRYPPGVDFASDEGKEICNRANVNFTVKGSAENYGDIKSEADVREWIEDDIQVSCKDSSDDECQLSCLDQCKEEKGIKSITNCLNEKIEKGDENCLLDEWVAAAQERCEAMGDCGGRVHFDTNVKIKSGARLKAGNLEWVSKDCKINDEYYDLSQAPPTYIFGFIPLVPGIILIVFLVVISFFVIINFTRWNKKFGRVGHIITLSLLLCLVIVGSSGCWCTVDKCEEGVYMTFTFECNPVEIMPSQNGDTCEKCNDFPLKPCSEYRCMSMGSDCKWSANDGVCYWEADVNAPRINQFNVETPTECVFSQSSPGNVINIKQHCTTLDQCLPAYTPLKIKYETNEPTRCKWDLFLVPEFDDMEYEADDQGPSFKQKHTFTISPSQIGRSPDPTKPWDVSIYLKCKDTANNVGSDYTIQFCLTKEPDWTPPMIRASIESGSKFPETLTQLPIRLYTNEPTKCKYDKYDRTYEEMSSAELRLRSKETVGPYEGWAYNDTTLQLEPYIQNTFYFKCKDDNNNIGTWSLVLNPAPSLKIVSILPENGTTIGGCTFYPRIELKATTAEGAEEGKATCYWKHDFESIWIEFDETGDTLHVTNASVSGGWNTLQVKCKDSATTAENQTTINVTADQIEPNIIRIYKSGSQLILRTDEKATCTYHFSAGRKINDCNFAANDTLYARQFSSTGGLEHRTEWDDEPWYVKCYDECKNGWLPGPVGCVIIYPQELG